MPRRGVCAHMRRSNAPPRAMGRARGCGLPARGSPAIRRGQQWTAAAFQRFRPPPRSSSRASPCSSSCSLSRSPPPPHSPVVPTGRQRRQGQVHGRGGCRHAGRRLSHALLSRAGSCPRAGRGPAAGVVGCKGAGAADAFYAGPGARRLPPNSRCKFLRCPVGRSRLWAGWGWGLFGRVRDPRRPRHTPLNQATPPRPLSDLAQNSPLICRAASSPTAAFRCRSQRNFALHGRTRPPRGRVRRCSARRCGCNAALAAGTGVRRALSRG